MALKGLCLKKKTAFKIDIFLCYIKKKVVRLIFFFAVKIIHFLLKTCFFFIICYISLFFVCFLFLFIHFLFSVFSKMTVPRTRNKSKDANNKTTQWMRVFCQWEQKGDHPQNNSTTLLHRN